MLNRPKFLMPSVNMQECCAIDINSDPLPFSCIVDGNDYVSAWQIVISRLNDNVVVFDTGKQSLGDSPFFPVDNRNRNITFQKDLKDYWDFVKKDSNSNELFVNSKDAYYWNIVLWDSSDKSVLGCEEVFYANSVPEISISYSDDGESYHLFKEDDGVNIQSLEKRMYYFKADYNQAEGIPLKKYGWRITDIINNQVLFDTVSKNQIYGTAGNVSCEYNGFVNDFEYLIELYIETQNGYSAVVKKHKFKVAYTVKTLISNFDIESINSSSCIMLDWGNLKTTEGVAIGDNVDVMTNFPITSYDAEGNPTGSDSLKIGADSMVVFEGNINANLEIPESAYTVLSFQIIDDIDTMLFDMSGIDKYGYEVKAWLNYTAKTKSLTYTYTKTNGDYATIEYTLSHPPAATSWYIVKLCPFSKDKDENMTIDMLVTERVAKGALYPSNTIYPQTTRYPYNGQWNDES